MDLFLSQLPGIIWALALGVTIGNFCCSAIFRLPTGAAMFVRKPYCGNCGTDLAVKDLFPVISFLLLRGKCRYCRTPIPSVYTVVEMLCGALFVTAYLQYNFTEEMILICTIGSFLIIFVSIEHMHGAIEFRMLGAAAIAAALLRTLVDAELYPFLFSGFICFMLATGMQMLKGNKQRFTVFSILFAFTGAALGHFTAIVTAIVLTLTIDLLLGIGQRASTRLRLPVRTLPLSLSVVLLLLFPVIELHLQHAIQYASRLLP